MATTPQTAAERPLMTAPQPVRDASVANDNWRHGAPSTGPWFKNQGFLHMSRARTHRRETLIMRSGFPLGENPLVLSHHCRGLMYSRPNGITLDAAAIRPSNLWNCLTVSDWPSLTLLTDVKIYSIEQETFVPASWSNSTPRLNKWYSEPEKAHFLWRLVSTPTVSYERGWHLDVSPPPSPTELESASRRYNLVSDALQPQWS